MAFKTRAEKAAERKAKNEQRKLARKTRAADMKKERQEAWADLKKAMRPDWNQIKHEVVEKQERKLLAKSHGPTPYVFNTKVFHSELPIWLERGWEIVSHTQGSDVSWQYYVLRIERVVLEGRFS